MRKLVFANFSAIGLVGSWLWLVRANFYVVDDRLFGLPLSFWWGWFAFGVEAWCAVSVMAVAIGARKRNKRKEGIVVKSEGIVWNKRKKRIVLRKFRS